MESIKLKPRSKRERALYDQAKNEGLFEASAQLSAEKRRYEESRVKLAKDTDMLRADLARLEAVPQVARTLYELCIVAGIPSFADRRR